MKSKNLTSFKEHLDQEYGKVGTKTKEQNMKKDLKPSNWVYYSGYTHQKGMTKRRIGQ